MQNQIDFPIEKGSKLVLSLWTQGHSYAQIAQALKMSKSNVCAIIIKEQRLSLAEELAGSDDKIRVTRDITLRIVNLLLKAGFEHWSQVKSIRREDLLEMHLCGERAASQIIQEIRRRFP
jgi:hypothetical protein